MVVVVVLPLTQVLGGRELPPFSVVVVVVVPALPLRAPVELANMLGTVAPGRCPLPLQPPLNPAAAAAAHTPELPVLVEPVRPA